MNRTDLELYTADVEAREKLAAAKDAHRAKPTPGNKEKLTAAKQAVFELRSHWRGIREATSGGSVPSVNVKTRSN